MATTAQTLSQATVRASPQLPPAPSPPPIEPPAPAVAPPRGSPWTTVSPQALADVRAGRPLVVHVRVALCSNRQIDCGSQVAGQPRRPETNIYWGALYGTENFLLKPKAGWTHVQNSPGEPPHLRRLVVKRAMSGQPWGVQGEIELVAVMDAIAGDQIDRAVLKFHEAATRGSTVTIRDADIERTLRVHVNGYLGHNRMMDGLKLPIPSDDTQRRPTPSFVLACYSESYFSAALTAAGSRPVLMTSALMAPEGYVLHAVLTALGGNESEQGIRQKTVAMYAKWQKLKPYQAGRIFAKR